MLTQNKIKTTTGAKLIVQTLKSLGVDTIFGYPGGVVLDLYDELYKDGEIRHILTRHEQSAIHAAEGYARESGKCAVVLVTSGPGATNTITGIANAYLDGYPIVVLTGQVSKNLLGNHSFQEVNICEITKTCAKRTFQITSADDIQFIMQKAFQTATSGKKGPVVVDLVKDIFKQETKENKITNICQKKQVLPTDTSLNTDDLLSKINNAHRPIIVAGAGVKHSNAQDDVFKFSCDYSIPVVSTMMGLGSFPPTHKNYLGMIGMYGDNAANQAINDSDLVISLGARFNDRITNRENLNNKLFQIDINPNEISRNITAIGSITADIKQVITNIKIDKTFNSWLEEVQKYRNNNKTAQKETNLMHSFEVLKELDNFTKDMELSFTSEVGQHQLWAIKNLTISKNRQIYLSGGSGTMGFGFPAAIGAAIANRNKSIICITGDGSFQMGLHELATCKDYDLDVKIIILNNGYLGMVRQMQEKFCSKRYYETKISNPDFIALAQSYGIDAIRVSNTQDIKPALEKAFLSKHPYIIEFIVEPMENV